MNENIIAAICEALKKGERVELKQLRDGTIKIQTVYRKDLKT